PLQARRAPAGPPRQRRRRGLPAQPRVHSYRGQARAGARADVADAGRRGDRPRASRAARARAGRFVMRSSLRVYFVTHHNGKLTGRLLAHGWTEQVPAVFGATEAEVYAGLEQIVADMIARHDASIDAFLWDEGLNVRTVSIEVHPLAVVRKRWVIGKDAIPLRLAFAWSKLGPEHASTGYRVLLPRFGWWFILEDLDIAPQVLGQAV